MTKFQKFAVVSRNMRELARILTEELMAGTPDRYKNKGEMVINILCEQHAKKTIKELEELEE